MSAGTIKLVSKLGTIIIQTIRILQHENAVNAWGGICAWAFQAGALEIKENRYEEKEMEEKELKKES